MKMLVAINLVFALGFAGMLIAHVTNNYAWLGFIGVWCAAEGVLARDHTIKWWQWALLLTSLACLDGAVLLIFGH